MRDYENMNGQDWCDALFHEIYLPILRNDFAEIASQVSAGVLGTGSEVLGADDALSRDHGWGPEKCHLFMDGENLRDFGNALQVRLCAALPDSFHGYRIPKHKPEQIQILTVDRLYADLTGLPHPPKTMQEWLKTDENALCFANAGRIISDPTGVLTARKSEFEKAYYPEDLWRWRVASQLWAIWHYGDYNGCRIAKRGDALGYLIGQGYFVEGVMRLCVLLNREYAPYWKWLHWAFSRLPRLADKIEPLLNELEKQSSLASRSENIHRIFNVVLDVLFEEKLLPEKKWYNFGGTFEVLQGIHDEEVRLAIKGRTPFFFIW